MAISRKPALPAAVAARMAKRKFMVWRIGTTVAPHDRFLSAIRNGEDPDREDLRIVAMQLERALAGESFRRAFGLQAGQGRKSDNKVDLRNQHIAAEVAELRKERFSLSDASELVAARYHVTADYVSKIHKAKRKEDRETRKRHGLRGGEVNHW
jgi:hypothetical protein